MNNLYSEENQKILSRIVELEYGITKAIFDGHKCSDSDIFKENREELKKLRKQIGIIK
jgi:hypothetical protein